MGRISEKLNLLSSSIIPMLTGTFSVDPFLTSSSSISQSRKNNIEGQINLFDMGGDTSDTPSKDILPDIGEYSIKDKLAFEREVLGLFLSGSPLAEYEDIIDKRVNCTSYDLNPPDTEYGILGEKGL